MARRPTAPAGGETPRQRAAAGNPSADALAQAITDFGRIATSKFVAGDGSPEDHLRGPFETLLRAAGKAFGLKVVPVGETRKPELGIRPDYAIEVADARVGYVELKKPGSNHPGTWTQRARNSDQWSKLSLLPNVLYCDGNYFACYRAGELAVEPAVLAPDIRRAGGKLRVESGSLEAVLRSFLTWEPERPRNVRQLVRAVAGLCRLLRREVEEISRREHIGEIVPARFSTLAHEWRGLLFPNLTDAEFADAYAQTVTFSLLLARVEGIDFTNKSVEEIAFQLRKKHSLMGRALAVLVDNPAQASVAIDTLVRVIGVVQWEDFDHDTYIYLFERFLADYAPEDRQQSGSYYTPDEVVSFMVRFVDGVLRRELHKKHGVADDSVIVVDPAMGTGSFLARTIDIVADTVYAEEGPGQVAPRLRALSRRLIGFEKQAAPYAVAQLRLHNLLKNGYGAEVPAQEFRFLTDALDNPFAQEMHFGSTYDEILSSRKGANRVKLEPVMVMLGNPPYRERARGAAHWVEGRGNDRVARPNLDAFRAAGNGKFEYVLSNLYVYFWRWATWKVFDAHPEQPAGVVALITPSSFLTGPGFAGMRQYLRETADEGWIVDLSPEGHQPPMNTRIFPGTQHPLCIGIFVRRGLPNSAMPAEIHYLQVEGTQADKFGRLASLDADDPAWLDCPKGWQDPLVSESADDWDTHPQLNDLMPWAAPGVKPNRTWVYAPEPDLLRARWRRLTAAPRAEKKLLFKESDARDIDSRVSALSGYPPIRVPISEERGECPEPVEVAFRPFDRQWTIPDNRLHHRASPDLWRVRSDDDDQQVFVSEQHAEPVGSGPALLFAAHIPDMHHFNGRGGRNYPLYRDLRSSVYNAMPGLDSYLANKLLLHVTPKDILAYVAAVTAHPGYTHRFRKGLALGGVRVPLTTDPETWQAGVEIGREVIWLQTYGRRYFDETAGRPRSFPMLPVDRRPKVQAEIPDTEDGMPDVIDYDAEAATLLVGAGTVHPVPEEVWQYEVSGWHVVRRWFNYRKRKPAGKRVTELDRMNARTWTPEMTTELLRLLNVLSRCVELHPRQGQLLERVMSLPRITASTLADERLLPVPHTWRQPPTRRRQPSLLDNDG